MPKGIKLYFCTTARNNFTASSATKKDPTNPIVRSISSFVEKEKLFCIRSSPLAASIVGIARRNEKMTAVFLFTPKSLAPNIVAADRETPGIIDKD